MALEILNADYALPDLKDVVSNYEGKNEFNKYE